MTFNILPLFFFLTYTLSLNLFAGIDSCNKHEIEQKLESMHISKNVHKNHQLIKEVRNQYDDNFVSFIKERNPHLILNPNGAIDIKTLVWIEQVIDQSMHTPFRYKFFPFETNLTSEFEVLIKEVTSEFNIPFLRNMVIFRSKEQAESFVKAISNLEKTIEIIKVTRKKLSTTEQIQLANNVIEYYKNKNNYKIGLVDLPDNPIIQIIQIISHGGVSENYIMAKRIKMTYQELVELLNILELPEHSTLVVDSCWSACPIYLAEQEKIPKKVILESTRNGTLSELFLFKSNPNFLSNLSKQLFISMPNFKGKIIGFVGYVTIGIKDGVYVRVIDESSNTHSLIRQNGIFSTSIDTKDGHIFISRDDASITVTRENVGQLTF